MNNRGYAKPRKNSRLGRVERKCDIILSELAAIRNCVFSNSHSIDDVIDRMHRNARQMRAEAEKDARLLRRVFEFK